MFPEGWPIPETSVANESIAKMGQPGEKILGGRDRTKRVLGDAIWT